jgi:hypothetical protein
MNQKSSLQKVPQFVSGVLTVNKRDKQNGHFHQQPKLELKVV